MAKCRNSASTSVSSKSSMTSTKRVKLAEKVKAGGVKQSKPTSGKKKKTAKTDAKKPKKPPTAFFYFLFGLSNHQLMSRSREKLMSVVNTPTLGPIPIRWWRSQQDNQLFNESVIKEEAFFSFNNFNHGGLPQGIPGAKSRRQVNARYWESLWREVENYDI
nr:uncharacterized protein LOC101247480 isoform X1 [Solanum lycopersicum]XP_025884914.1 uncharacterized protein LOC101247480 isoform X1 [Solanum lycopersicum]XP_025884915.1 uncharacterized protein LOC101247480 isoform X1 [Solanum lycopersicum]